MKWLQVLIYTYITGLLFFYGWAYFTDVRDNWWIRAFFTWDNIADGGVLAWGAIYYTIKPTILRLLIMPVWIFSMIRLAWELISNIFGLPISDPPIVALFFVILLGVCTYIELIVSKKVKKYYEQ